MSKRILALAGCIAATTPVTTNANILPESLVGLSLGEVRSSSFLNETFKGVIPFLFTKVENIKGLDVKLAPQYIFDQIGAEKHPILNQLNFQITEQNNKPVILISSSEPIRLPFLNFVLEIIGPEGSLYQDYTVLLDPATEQQSQEVEHVVFDQSEDDDSIWVSESSRAESGLEQNANTHEVVAKQAVVKTKAQQKYRVRTGDSLSKIASRYKSDNLTTQELSQLIFENNPRAFVRGDANKLKKGALLDLPNTNDIDYMTLASIRKAKSTYKTSQSVNAKKKNIQSTAKNTKPTFENQHSQYTVAKGDSLFKITKRFAPEETSVTEMMGAIFKANQHAFINHSKNRLIAGAKLSIPTFESTESIADQQHTEKEFMVDADFMASEIAKSHSQQSDLSSQKELQAVKYQIKEGDTLSFIAKTVGYPEVPFAKMLKAIYAHNPHAFIDGSMTNLAIGEVITLPPSSSFNEVANSLVARSVVARNLATKNVVTNNVATDKAVRNTGLNTAKTNQQAKSVKTSSLTESKNAPSNDLVRRIRELRKELEQTKGRLSTLKKNLNKKDELLQRKDIQIQSLEATVSAFNSKTIAQLFPVSSVAYKNKRLLDEHSEESNEFKSALNAELLKLEKGLLKNVDKPQKQLAKIEALKQQIMSPFEVPESTFPKGLFKHYSTSDLIKFTQTNYFHLSYALILCLLLIRYRRQLYSYTYSAINYDQPSYYPIPDADKLVLKEKNINFHDSKMDQVAKINESLNDEPAEPKIVIDPLLVEAQKDTFKDKKVPKEIKPSDHSAKESSDHSFPELLMNAKTFSATLKESKQSKNSIPTTKR